jgi:hypothetical protein
VAGTDQSGSLGEQQRTEIAKSAHYEGAGGLGQLDVKGAFAAGADSSGIISALRPRRLGLLSQLVRLLLDLQILNQKEINDETN